MATKWPKPAEGSWTQHYPDLGTGPIPFQDSISAEFYAMEREAIFKRAWLNISRIEETPEAGSFITRQIEAADASLLLVKTHDGDIRAFHNLCRRRGHPVVSTDFRATELRNTGGELECRHCGWRYGLDGRLLSRPDEDSFIGLDAADYGLVPVHCDVWAGFVFVNFDREPAQTLRDFLGPMVTALDDYPFGKLTERYDWVAHNNSNWKIFADAFQEYYHVPSLHTQQVPPEVRDPNAGFTCGHFQLDGPHRLVSTAGTRRWLLAPEYMYPIERATQSGLVGPWRTPDIGELPAGLNPGNIEPWGISNFQIFPNLEILIYGGWYLLYRYWPTSHNTHRFEAFTYFHPARTVRERIEHEVAAVVLKEFALQDAGMLGGTQAALEYDVIDDFPLNDQEILVRHLHKMAVDWVEDYQRERTPAGASR
ncbi:aromatic ring-hydroxylating oxygenase subunit alpha [Mycolicibacterium neworleansense]|uniref:Rieske (2Fe-2S) domain-containing protein n=1 Tax=Mycolicibacterium neworleansense TaxID=146018 RepID=A0A0H5RSR1_9MYCO|nr:aromatic ring-hydroxylating dioxygenase subunit alpha [Mycolicibacterium neworleansense]MCV7361622.1 aromatic ring-hydroxylating dioxygenase subunit alpha [Mycolicibacterium neworleansense]CRZ16978.1 Rieske (2Fe-2S) domain-containing protein [Mycolicibacterium neworleansense]